MIAPQKVQKFFAVARETGGQYFAREWAAWL